MIPEVAEVLSEIKSIHEKKNLDYSTPGNHYENFERSSLLMSWFHHDIDKAFVSLIGTKLARLAVLLNSGKGPENESIDDSFLDLCTYCILWKANYMYRKIIKKLGLVELDPKQLDSPRIW